MAQKWNAAPRCPVCGSDTKAMTSGKGFRCINGTVKKIAGKWVPSGCEGVVWNKNNFAKKDAVERATDFPTIKSPTPEQLAIEKWLATAPGVKQSRFLQVNAGPGTGKTATLAWGCKALRNRVGNLSGWHFLAFNTNAKDVLLNRLPVEVGNVSTLNSYFGGAQGYKYANYDAQKSKKIFWGLCDHLPRDKRPHFHPISSFIERMRDLLLCCDNPSDAQQWADLIQSTMIRFGGLCKAYDKNSETVNEYLPQVFARSMADKKTIDLSEQYAKPAMDAVQSLGWKMPNELIDRQATWTDENVRHFCKLIRAIKLPQVSLIVDEAQDMSLPIFAAAIASTWKNGELVIIGDDRHGNRGDADYQAGQGIYGWRGAGGGLFALAERVWAELTGENCDKLPLSITFRNSPAIVAAFQSLNMVLRSGRKDNAVGGVYNVSADIGFAAFLAIPDDQTALYVSRRNAPLAPLLLEAIKAHKQVCLRGNGQLVGAVERVLTGVAKNSDGKFSGTLAEAMDTLESDMAENNEPGQESPDQVEAFVLHIGRALLADHALLQVAELSGEPTCEALIAFVAYFNDRKANRTLSTVYRCKGDEADLVVVDDVEQFNAAWNDDQWESEAVRHVAASRARNWLLTIGSLSGVIAGTSDPEALLKNVACE